MTIEEKAEKYAKETSLEKGTYKGDVQTAYVCGAMETYNSMNGVEVDVKKWGGNWSPYFKIGNQSFTLQPCEDKEGALFIANELRSALRKIK